MTALLNLIDKPFEQQVLTESGVSPSQNISGCLTIAVQLLLGLSLAAVKTFVQANVNATASTIAITAHGYQTGYEVELSAAGALPDPLMASTSYYVIRVNANTIQLALTVGDALAGTFIDLTNTGANQTTTVTPATPSVSVQLKHSPDSTNFYPLGSPVVPTQSANYFLGNVDPVGKFLRVDYTLLNATVTTDMRMLGKGLA